MGCKLCYGTPSWYGPEIWSPNYVPAVAEDKAPFEKPIMVPEMGNVDRVYVPAASKTHIPVFYGTGLPGGIDQKHVLFFLLGIALTMSFVIVDKRYLHLGSKLKKVIKK